MSDEQNMAGEHAWAVRNDQGYWVGIWNDRLERDLAAAQARVEKLLQDTLDLLESGTEKGITMMGTMEGRNAWYERMKPIRERIRAALAGERHES